ncbi:hypothetical protein JCM6882_004540, partial [Rhodosporidiobolus microsporus]
MPVPPLGLDIVRLIVDELQEMLPCTGSRNESGLAVALVCKDWKDMGLALAWESVIFSLEPKEKRSLERLMASPTRRQHIKRIYLVDTFEQELQAVRIFVVSPEMLSVALEIVASCEHLSSLILKVLGDNCKHVSETILEAVPRSLEHLFFGCSQYSKFDPAGFIRLLAGFPALQRFEAMLLVESTEGTAPPPSDAILTACLPFRTLELEVPSHASLRHSGPNDFLRGLETALDSSALDECIVSLSPDQIFFFEFLSTCPNLTALVVRAASAGELSVLLPQLVPTMQSFSSVQSLQFKLGTGEIMEETAGLPCPVEVQTFLAALPSSVKAVLLGGLYFTWPSHDVLPVIPGRIHPNWFQLSLRTVLCFGAEEGKVPERSMIMLFLFPDRDNVLHRDKNKEADYVEQVLYTSKIISYSQSFVLMREAA